MERFTRRVDGGVTCDDIDGITKGIAKLADYEDAEEQGRLIEFPVALGDHLWFVNDYGIIDELTVTELAVSPSRGKAMFAESPGLKAYYSLEHIGKRIFYSRDEAEAKLAEMEAGNGNS